MSGYMENLFLNNFMVSSDPF